MAQSTTRAAQGEPLRWLNATITELQANPTEACIEWPFGKTDKGYGMVWVNGRGRSVSAVVLESTKGPAPAGMQACHQPIVCHNGGCVNPRHLRWDTYVNNNLDKLLDGMTNPKLTTRDAWEIRELHGTGEWSQSQLATEFQVSNSTIRNVLDGRTWRHIVGVPRPSERDHPPLFT